MSNTKTTTQQLDAVQWFRGFFEMPDGVDFVDRRQCPACGRRMVQARHRTGTAFAALRPTWSCLECRHSGVGVFSLVKALNRGLPTLDRAVAWLEQQGITVSAEIRETGAGQFPLGPDGSNLLHQTAHIAKHQARRKAAAAARVEEAAQSPEARIQALEKQVSELKARRAK